MINRLIRFCLENKLIVALLFLAFVLMGIGFAPFDWEPGIFPRSPLGVDAIPDIGENQQIVFTEWPGRSPQDLDDQITYPLTTALLGVPGVKTIRSSSMLGLSSIYIIFDENIDFYWSRSRILEKLNSLPSGTLPQGVNPALGPDATALGQVFWYTLEGLDPQGNAAGGWDLDELRSIQDWYVRYGLMSAEGIAEVASVGGFVREYQIDVDPDAMRAWSVSLDEIYNAVQKSNVDVGARTIEINRIEYVVRGLGFIKNLADIEKTVIKVNDNVPVSIKDIGNVSLGPAGRRGALDKGGAEAVGGVVVVRHGYNPLQAIKNIKQKIEQIAPGMPQKTLADGTVSKVTIVPFYDRTGLIYETLGTLENALIQQILVTIIVVIVLVVNLRSSILISSMLPLTVLVCFIVMKLFRVDANIVALSGIAIAIGTVVDMGIVICENIINHLESAEPGQSKLQTIYQASSEVGGAIFTAVATTVVGFLPVFAMTGAEGKLFRPLAFTKTFAIVASIVIALTILPPAALLLLKKKKLKKSKAGKRSIPALVLNIIIIAIIIVVLGKQWMPLGYSKGIFENMIFIVLLLAVVLIPIYLFKKFYQKILGWALRHKLTFISIPMTLIVLGAFIWSGLGKEFMPPLDEGSFLYMPTVMPHASLGEALDVMQKQNIAFQAIPEVDSVVGKIGRVESALDPAPISMIETVISYQSEYITDKDGKILKFQYDHQKQEFIRDENGNLIADKKGRVFRNWREHIKNSDDIWHEIIEAGKIPGSTSAPKLQPIAARLVMLQSGMRAPMGIKVKGPDLETIDRVSLELEALIKQVPSVEPAAVIADRIVGKPYLEIDIDRDAIARYGISIVKVQDIIEVAIGGKRITTTVQGRQRYPVRIRYMRELRDQIESMEKILVPAANGVQIPMSQLAKINYVRGPQAIKSEDTFLIGYVLFDKKDGYAEVDVVEECQEFLAQKIADGQLIIPAGVSYEFAGSYQNQLRAQKKLAILIPLSLFIIFLILYFNFKSVSVSMLVFSGIIVAWAGGFIMIWLYGQHWFMDFSIFGINLRGLFNIYPVNLSVAIWVGFLALFGIASDDGVVMCTYLEQSFKDADLQNISDIREKVIEAGSRRVRPCLMTTATTILALIPVLTSTGRGSDIMIPMAIPVFGGMIIEVLTMLVVPVLYSFIKEAKLKR